MARARPGASVPPRRTGCAAAALVSGLATALLAAAPLVATAASPAPAYRVEHHHARAKIDRFELYFDLPAIAGGAPAFARLVARTMRDYRARERASLRKICKDGCVGEEQVSFAVASADAHLLSVRVYTFFSMRHAAHPSHRVQTFTWAVAPPRLLALGDLFRPGAPYLQRLSRLSRAKLRRMPELLHYSDTDWIAAGTRPVAKSFAAWTVGVKGLTLTFNEYQVAAYVVGAVDVPIGWPALRPLLDPDGPLRHLLR